MPCVGAGVQQRSGEESGEGASDSTGALDQGSLEKPSGSPVAVVIGPLIAVCLVLGACAAAAVLFKRRQLRLEEKSSKKAKKHRVRVR